MRSAAIPSVLTSMRKEMGVASTGMAHPTTTRSIEIPPSHVSTGCFLLLGIVRPLHVPVYITKSPYVEQ